MKYLLAVSNLEAARQLEAMIGQVGMDPVVRIVQSLSEAYHVAEHETPDFAFIGPKFARDPLFPGLNSLLNSLPVARAILLPTGPSRQEVAALATSLKFPTLDAHLGPYVFLRGLMNIGHGPGEPGGDAIDASRLILVGASTGGVDALLQVLAAVKPNSPPVVIVQHTSRGFGDGLVRLLSGSCRAKVLAARDGEALEPGKVYLATDADRHLIIDPANGLSCKLLDDGKISGHRPSIDALFRSAIPVAEKVSAALLTGMGSDGAEGLLGLRKGGAMTFGQDKASCIVYGMPRVAFEIGAVQRQMPPFEIGTALLGSCSIRKDQLVN